MKRSILILLFLFCISISTAQEFLQNKEQFPLFPECDNSKTFNLESCFYTQVQKRIYDNFKVPNNLNGADFKTSIIVLFEVNEQGKFEVQYVDSDVKELIDESKRVFELFPIVSPPRFNGKPTYSKYTIKIRIPLESTAAISVENKELKTEQRPKVIKDVTKELTEYDAVVNQKFNNLQFESHLNIPFSHSYYAQFDSAMNQFGANNHTASKPYTYSEVSKYYNLEAENQKLMESKTSWWGRKLWNEYLVQIQGDDYWFTLNPIYDLQLGKSNSTVSNKTFMNTRGIQIQGGLGKQLNFTTTVYESQGSFPDYFSNYSRSIKPSGGNPAIIPGIGIAKDFKSTGFDMPMAEANLTYVPNKMIDMQLGYGRNFIGDGYRSLITTDGVSPYPYFKINTSFWKIKYTNTYMFLKDVRPEVYVDRTYATKYMANHYLSLNVTKRLNIGLFESVVWANTNNRGFEAGFVNPIIFYRSVEFASSSKTGNALLGLTAKYKFNNQINFYGQFLLDEFSVNDIKKADNSWKNKYGYQLGLKYYNAFNLKNLLVQLEFNNVRPYVYSHSNPLTNYGNNNQSLGHQWGGNFKEFIAIVRYHQGRFFSDAKFTFGKRGLDFNSLTNNFNYGSNIYRSYEEQRPFNIGVTIGQGNTTTVFIADTQVGYLINPATNLKFFGSMIYRNFDPLQNTVNAFKQKTNWFSLGLRCDIFNWYFDY